MNAIVKQRGPTVIEASSAEMETKESTLAVANGLDTKKIKGQSKPAVQKKLAVKDEALQRKEKGAGGREVSAGFQAAVSASKGGGNKLDAGLQNSFGAKFGADFHQVKVHNNNRSHKLAEAVNARAFTVGQDIYFNKGQYQPESKSGKKLLAHELTHTIQQRSNHKKVQRQDAEKVSAPPKTAQAIIDANTSYFDLHEFVLGRELHTLAKASSSNYQLVLDVFKLLNSENKVEVSDGMIQQMENAAIRRYTSTSEGRQFLTAVSSYMTQGGMHKKRLLKLFPTERDLVEYEREAAMKKLKERGNTAEVNFYPDYKGMDSAEESLKGIGKNRGKLDDVVSFGVEKFPEVRIYLEIVSKTNGNVKNFIRVLHFLGHGRGGEDAAFGFGKYMTGLDIMRGYDTGMFSNFMVEGGSVLMEGCSVARGANGKAFLKEVARITFGNDKTGYIKGNQCTVIAMGEITVCNPLTLRWPSDF